MRHEHGFHRDTPVTEACEAFLDLVTPIDRTTTIGLAKARGRVLAETVVAPRDVPHYDRAAMDGWAVRAADTHGASRRNPRTLDVVGGSTVESGTAARVHTGSPVPEGADAVVMVEDTAAFDGTIEVYAAVAQGRHVGHAGEDVAAGEPAVEMGATVTPSAMALLRSLEVDELTVVDQPTVAVIPTGEELVDADPDPGEVIETNGLMVAQYAEAWGARPEYHDIVDDDHDALARAITAATEADLIVTTGGSSVGERDLLPEVVEELGKLTVHGVAIQPGHPVGLGHVDDTPMAILPGYPVSCAVTAHEFVRPAIRRLARARDTPDPTVECVLAEKIASKVGRRSITRVTLEQTPDGWVATPTMTSGAGILSSMAQTDAVVICPESVEGYDRGERVTAVIWE